MPDHLECSVLDPVERAVEFAVAPTEKTTLVQLSPDSMATAARYGSPVPSTAYILASPRTFWPEKDLVKLLGVVPLAGHRASITKTGHRDRAIRPNTITAADSSPAGRRAASTYFTADQLHTKLSQVRFWPETRPSEATYQNVRLTPDSK
jgi:hypothetical protein